MFGLTQLEHALQPKSTLDKLFFLIENAFTRAGEWWRAGDLLRLPNSAGVGDLGRFAADAKGDELDANASKPVRLRLDSRGGEPEASTSTGVGFAIGLGAVFVLVLAEAQGEGFMLLNRLGPLTDAKGELVEA